MVIKRLEDIEREKHEQKREKLIVDINHVLDGVFKSPKKEKNVIWIIGKILLLILLVVIFVNLVLGNIWLLKFFWEEFF